MLDRRTRACGSRAAPCHSPMPLPHPGSPGEAGISIVSMAFLSSAARLLVEEKQGRDFCRCNTGTGAGNGSTGGMLRPRAANPQAPHACLKKSQGRHASGLRGMQRTGAFASSAAGTTLVRGMNFRVLHAGICRAVVRTMERVCRSPSQPLLRRACRSGA